MAKIICDNCGKTYIGRSRALKSKHKFCSTDCLSNYYRSKWPTKKCLYCGKDFIFSPDKRCKGIKFCSTDCSKKARIINIPVTCNQCGKQYNVKPNVANRNKKHYCSDKCRKDSYTIAMTDLVCPVCNKAFQKPTYIINSKVKSSKKGNPKIMCSKECYKNWAAQNSKENCRNSLFVENKYEFNGEFCTVFCNSRYSGSHKNKVTIDKEDYYKVKENTITISKSRQTVSVHICLPRIKEKQPNVKELAKYLLDIDKLKPGECISHIDGNSFNFCKSNLRLHDRSSALEAMKLQDRNISGVKGITYDKVNKKWRSVLIKNKVKYWLGRHSTIEQAKAVRILAEQQLHKYGTLTKDVRNKIKNYGKEKQL